VVARARAALGRAHLEAGSAERAREELRTALDLADHCGSVGLASLVRAELVRAGGRPRRNRLTGPEALTPNERRTAELVAAGATNREVAETLFLTVRAVEAQMTSIYRKLGTQSRLELVRTVQGWVPGTG
jgi:DNA-binding CsgD family transcriptional regulator